jgi:Phosphate-selective porin O and P
MVSNKWLLVQINALILMILLAVQTGGAERSSESMRIEELERTVAITGGLNYYIRGDDLKLMLNYIHTWSDFREANPEFGEDQFDEVIGRVQLMF